MRHVFNKQDKSIPEKITPVASSSDSGYVISAQFSIITGKSGTIAAPSNAIQVANAAKLFG